MRSFSERDDLRSPIMLSGMAMNAPPFLELRSQDEADGALLFEVDFFSFARSCWKTSGAIVLVTPRGGDGMFDISITFQQVIAYDVLQ